jgi:hypothetical protein
MQKCLILLVFVSYEAVRLWWWGGNCGVVDFEKIPLPRSIPTPASHFKARHDRFDAELKIGS